MLTKGENVKKYIVILLCLMITGCASFKGVKYGGVNHPPTDPTSIKVFSYAPPGEYVRIGEVSAKGAPLSNRDNMVEKLKEQAGGMGGDAIILEIQEVERGVAGNVNAYGGFSARTQYEPRMTGVVIKYEE